MDTTALAIFRYLLSLVSTTQNATLDSGGGFMPVVIERIGADTYSIAHYGQQNGDLMADPELTFRGDGTPLTYQNDYVGIYTETCDVEFVNLWMRNIAEQQGIKL